jgi:hypothetical protein
MFYGQRISAIRRTPNGDDQASITAGGPIIPLSDGVARELGESLPLLTVIVSP